MSHRPELALPLFSLIVKIDILIYMMHEMAADSGEINYTQFLAANIVNESLEIFFIFFYFMILDCLYEFLCNKVSNKFANANYNIYTSSLSAAPPSYNKMSRGAGVPVTRHRMS